MNDFLEHLNIRYDKSLSKEQKEYIYSVIKYQEECIISRERCKDLLSSYLCDILHEEVIKSDFKNKETPVLICVVKNERIRMEYFFEHYRKIGISQFSIIDNNSSDGTKEICSVQDDVNLFSVDTEYSSARRVGWINQILTKYGRDRWYLLVDADELIDYVGSEEYTINHLIDKIKQQGGTRVLGLQVDFYPKEKLFSMKDDNIEWDKCVYFDYDTYIEQDSKRCVWFVGGPRKRVLNTFSLLTKYPLFYYDSSTLNISSHYLYPFDSNLSMPCILCIKHYEFINEKDYEKMKIVVEKGIYASKSREYVEMLEKIDKKRDLSFYDDIYSSKYTSSNDLLKVKYICDWK